MTFNYLEKKLNAKTLIYVYKRLVIIMRSRLKIIFAPNRRIDSLCVLDLQGKFLVGVVIVKVTKTKRPAEAF